jgi:t-SNARE complex subunit (syntaxin)
MDELPSSPNLLELQKEELVEGTNTSHYRLERINSAEFENLQNLQNAKEIKQIAHDTKLINEIYQDIGNLVSTQQQPIDQLENNVINTKTTIESSNEILSEAKSNSSSYRKKFLTAGVVSLGIVTITFGIKIGLGAALISSGLKFAGYI